MLAMHAVDPKIQSLLERYAAAVLAKDADALLGLYDRDVRLFDAWGTWSCDGAAPWREAVDRWFGSLGDERVRVMFADVAVVAEAALAVVSTIVTYAAETAAGEPLRSMDNRLTWALRDDGRGFVVVHEHTSAPIGVDDGRAILSRPRSP